MKKLSILLTALLVISILSSCSSANYKLIEKDGNYYIRLGSAVSDTASNSASNSDRYELVYTPIRFDTIAEMKQDIQTGNFSEEELRTINATFNKDEKGLIQISNISKLYEPTYPAVFDDYTVSWFSTGYSFEITSETTSIHSNLHIMTQEYNEEKIAYYSNFADLFTGESQSLLNSVSYNEEDGSTTYDFIDALNERRILTWRILENEAKTMHIVEDAAFKGSPAIVKYYYLIYGTINGMYFNANIASSQPLTLDQLSQFGIREYVDTVTE